MANSTASVKVNITAGSRSVAVTIAPTYNGLADGVIDVPDTTVSTTAYSIPFGSIASATAVWVQNKTGQPMSLKLNGSAALNNLPDGAGLLIAAAALATGPLTAVSLTTTATQSGAGTIEFLVLGDPV